MKCPQCMKEGKKSTVQLGVHTSTLMYYPSGYYDEDGKWKELEDLNSHFQEYRCSNGHEWEEKT